MIFDKYFNFL